MARFDLGDVVGSISELRRASAVSQCAGVQVQFSSTFAHFLRESDFLNSDSLIPHLTNLRQLATRVVDAESSASLHLAVARVEGFRGHFLTSHHHWELARSLASRSINVALQLTVDLIDASLESLAGNLQRAQHLASVSLEKSRGAGFIKYEIAALTNLAAVALNNDRPDKARVLLDRVLHRQNPSPMSG